MRPMDTRLKTKMAPSLSLLTIANIFHKEHTVIIENENIEDIDFDEVVDIVGITFTERGKGSFITEDEQIVDKLKDSMASELLKNFVDGMKELGYTNENIFDHLSNYMKED